MEALQHDQITCLIGHTPAIRPQETMAWGSLASVLVEYGTPGSQPEALCTWARCVDCGLWGDDGVFLYNLQEQCAWVCLHGLGGIPEKVYLALSGTL